MPFKLIGTIALLVIVTVFCGFNLENKCNVSFVFKDFQNVSVFVLVMCSFLAGILVTLPSVFMKKSNKKNKKNGRGDDKAGTADGEKTSGGATASSLDDSGEKTVFDFKIRRQTSDKKDEKKNEKAPKSDEK